MVVSDYVFMVSTMLILFYFHGDHDKIVWRPRYSVGLRLPGVVRRSHGRCSWFKGLCLLVPGFLGLIVFNWYSLAGRSSGLLMRVEELVLVVCS